MKKISTKFIVFIFCFCIFQTPCIPAQTPSSHYSHAAIQIYNEGVSFNNQGQYGLAEQKYNQALAMQPNFVEAKKSLAIVYKNLASKYYREFDYAKSITYANKSLTITPNNGYCYRIIANCYLKLNDNENLITTYKKIISLEPNNLSMLKNLGATYIRADQIDNATEIYRKILSINPNDSLAQQNLKYLELKHSDKVLNDSINRLNVGHIAPEKLYNQIKLRPGIDYSYKEKMKTILDLIWSEPNGEKLLTVILKNKASINITNNETKANAYMLKQTQTLYLYGIIPVSSYTTNQSVNINIPFSHIDNFNNPNMKARDRIYNLQVFIHEFGHAYIGIRKPQNTDSMEEEIGVSMIGLNIANKIITNNYLDSNQSENYSLSFLIGVLSDEHRNLPIYSGFNKTMRGFDIEMPYPEIYSDIPMMYKKLLSEGKVTPLPALDAYLK